MFELHLTKEGTHECVVKAGAFLNSEGTAYSFSSFSLSEGTRLPQFNCVVAYVGTIFHQAA